MKSLEEMMEEYRTLSEAPSEEEAIVAEAKQAPVHPKFQEYLQDEFNKNPIYNQDLPKPTKSYSPQAMAQSSIDHATNRFSEYQREREKPLELTPSDGLIYSTPLIGKSNKKFTLEEAYTAPKDTQYLNLLRERKKEPPLTGLGSTAAMEDNMPEDKALKDFQELKALQDKMKRYEEGVARGDKFAMALKPHPVEVERLTLLKKLANPYYGAETLASRGGYDSSFSEVASKEEADKKLSQQAVPTSQAASVKASMKASVKGGAKKAGEAPLAPEQATVPTPEVAFDPYGEDLNDKALKQAQEDAEYNRRLATIGKAGLIIGGAFGRTNLDDSVFQDIAKNADSRVKDIQTRREGKDKELSREKLILEFKDEKVIRDPNSDISSFARKTFEKVYGYPPPRKASAFELKKVGIDVGSMMSHDADRKLRELTARIAAEARMDAKQERLELKQKEQLNKSTERLGDRLNKYGAASAIATLNTIDDLMEGLDNNKKDLAGYGMLGGLTPEFLTSEEGVKLRTAVQKLANTALKNASGTAVSDQEYERFKTEFGTGSLKTERALRAGLRAYRDMLSRVVQGIEATSPKEALEEYRSRPGSVSHEDIPGAKTYGAAGSSKKSSKPSQTPGFDPDEFLNN